MPTSSLAPAVSNTGSPHVIVCGLGRFGLRVVECLREQAPDARITVITNATTRSDWIQRAKNSGVHLIIGDFRFADIRAQAGIAEATSIILSSAADADNLETALDARGEAPNIRILMRLDEGRIADRLMSDFGIDRVMSPPALAADKFSHAALEPFPNQEIPVDTKGQRQKAPRGMDSMLRLPRRYDSQRSLQFLASLLFLLFATGVLVFHHTLQIPVVDAIYFTATILTTVGFGDYHLKEQGPLIKLFGTLMMFGGVMLVALLTSFVTNFYLSGAASRLRAERIAERIHDHVIVCGLGTVGIEIVRDLAEQQIPTIVLDNTPDSSAVRLLEGRVAVLIGDATSEEALLRAGVLRARALIACLSDDAKNLEIGLTAQTLAQERGPHRPLRLVLRCFDADLARRIHAVSNDYTVLSSAEIAAPIFAKAALAPESEPITKK